MVVNFTIQFKFNGTSRMSDCRVMWLSILQFNLIQFNGTRVHVYVLEYRSILVVGGSRTDFSFTVPFDAIPVHVHVYFDKVSGALEGDTARVRAARHVALCEVAASLVKQQGYALAQIVAEIHALDLAAGDVGGAGVVARR